MNPTKKRGKQVNGKFHLICDSLSVLTYIKDKLANNE